MNKQDNYLTRHWTALKHKSIDRNPKLTFASIDFGKKIMNFEAWENFLRHFRDGEALVRTV